MREIIVKLKICLFILKSKKSVAATLHKKTNGKIMDHYKMSDSELFSLIGGKKWKKCKKIKNAQYILTDY